MKPTEPADALGTFTLKPGFRIELAAAEPLVVDPVAMAFDEHGRLYVIEMIGYSEHRKDRLGQVRLLEDTDGDGQFDRSNVYAHDLAWPTAVVCYDGGIFVGVTPDILYLKDTDGDHMADERRVVFTGFGNDVSKLNMQSLMNSFRWGLDNRIHGTASGTPGKVRVADRLETGTVSFVRADFSFDPRMLDFRIESGGAQHGMDFDFAGRKFVCSNSHHIQQVMYEDRYASGNPNFILPSPLVDIPVDGSAATVFRMSPDEIWRVIRTRWRVSGQVRGPVEGGGRPSGYFTAATGVTIYDGHTWPEGFSGDVFVADCGSNLLHRKKLLGGQIQFKAERPGDERDREFLASTDNWFRPVQMEVGPDGALYIADMYREVIEHPWSLPQGIKQHIDLDSGNDRGRIYRVVPEAFVQPKTPLLGQQTTAELVLMLDHPNGWHRNTAARLLYERQDTAAVEPLRLLVSHGQTGHGRMHSLYVLAGLGALKRSDLVKATVDASPLVRMHAIRLAEQFLSRHSARFVGSTADNLPLMQNLLRLADDLDLNVRYQLAWTLGEVEIPGKVNALVNLFRQAGDDLWQLAALFNAATESHAELIDQLKKDTTFANSSRGVRIIRNLETMRVGRLAKFSVKSKKAEYRPQVFKPTGKVNPDREKVVDQYLPALDKNGDAALGRVIFEQRCAACHRLGGVGREIGPDLKSARANGPEKLLVSLIDPNREVAPQYMLHKFYSVEEQKTIIGAIKFMSGTSILMSLPDGSERQIQRLPADRVESLGLSLMPVGLEAGLSANQMADLLAWLLESE